MISEKDRKTILKIARKYKIKKIILFGSSVNSPEKSRDIDLGVSGLPDSQFFAFYGELLMNLSKPVDVIDLDKKTRFKEIIEDEGIVIYG